VFYVLPATTGYGDALYRRDPMGTRTLVWISDPDEYRSYLDLLEIDRIGNMMVHWSMYDVLYSQWTGGWSALTPQARDIFMTESDPRWWGFHPDGYIMGTYAVYDVHGLLLFWDVAPIGPSVVLHSAADVDVRRGTAHSITYRFRLRQPGEETTVRRRGHSSDSFTWGFHSPPANYEVLASADNTLWVKEPVTVGASDVELDFVLPAGDLNGDNRISLLDLGLWLLAPVDLNNDGHAGTLDLAAILMNFGLVGDE
jgi:hypothetical protein